MSKRKKQAIRRSVAILLLLTALIFGVLNDSSFYQSPVRPGETGSPGSVASITALEALQRLAVKGRAPKTGYSRSQFGDGWSIERGCDTRNLILYRDLSSPAVSETCQVLSGVLDDPYTGKIINFKRGPATSAAIQIDHVVALSDAWQKGAQLLTSEQRVQFANDPLELLAVDGPANQQKGDGDAATWLPPNKAFRCQYVARQVAIKMKYQLWVTEAEKDAIERVLKSCPNEALPQEVRYT